MERKSSKSKCRFPLFPSQLFNKHPARQPAGATWSHFGEQEWICNFSTSTWAKTFSLSVEKRIQTLILFFFLSNFHSHNPCSRSPSWVYPRRLSVPASNVSNYTNYVTLCKTNAQNVLSSLLKTTSTHCHLSLYKLKEAFFSLFPIPASKLHKQIRGMFLPPHKRWITQRSIGERQRERQRERERERKKGGKKISPALQGSL